MIRIHHRFIHSQAFQKSQLERYYKTLKSADRKKYDAMVFKKERKLIESLEKNLRILIKNATPLNSKKVFKTPLKECIELLYLVAYDKKLKPKEQEILKSFSTPLMLEYLNCKKPNIRENKYSYITQALRQLYQNYYMHTTRLNAYIFDKNFYENYYQPMPLLKPILSLTHNIEQQGLLKMLFTQDFIAQQMEEIKERIEILKLMRFNEVKN
ncbi:hypothetical protein [Helicobacter cetorum]|uniref:Uncharacterized protein n=1 Tax=Helicobacter cetorum (strain ATCC BAA-429 / MIT 00-7128) TaxID=182217 RepID=I0EKR2_HELC0|nr:hypothetical protein [Helicobacter cetorum]AFI03531.1 hypothetical protein HCW_01200 [Helicobacter cetorum MIT 00-7128]